jgi:hypothetical protein
MQFTVLALFAAVSLVIATPVPEVNAHPLDIANLEMPNTDLHVRAKGNSHAPAPLRVGSNDSFQTNSCNGALAASIDSSQTLISISSSPSC